jgi:hypothetical protein
MLATLRVSRCGFWGTACIDAQQCAHQLLTATKPEIKTCSAYQKPGAAAVRGWRLILQPDSDIIVGLLACYLQRFPSTYGLAYRCEFSPPLVSRFHYPVRARVGGKSKAPLRKRNGRKSGEKTKLADISVVTVPRAVKGGPSFRVCMAQLVLCQVCARSMCWEILHDT